MALLEVINLTVSVRSASGFVPLVEDVSFAIERGETFCVVGESGSGKTVTAQAVIRLLEYAAPVETTGRVIFDGLDLVGATQRTMAGVRGRRLAMVFQECMEALNPTKRVGRQLEEVWDYHREWKTHPGGGTARERAIQVLRDVEMPDPEGCLDRYPHQLSGGMQQRAMIAMALMCDPELLIADEPTTALDVTIQAEILRKLRLLQRERGMALLLITHDMGIAAELADHIGVMYAGRMVETGPAASLLEAPQHPYTSGLLACVPRTGWRQDGPMPTIPGNVPGPGSRPDGCRFAPRCARATDECRAQEPPLAVPEDGAHPVACWHPISEPRTRPGRPLEGRAGDANGAAGGEVLVRLDDLEKVYARSARAQSSGRRAARRNAVVAVDHISLEINRGEFFGLVGETGSGKSTLGRLIAKLEEPTGGRVIFDGTDLVTVRRRSQEKAFRKQVQIVFQDPYASIDPRYTVERVIAEPLRALDRRAPTSIRERAFQLLGAVGLSEDLAAKRVDELSGGQRQRVAIARAMAVEPSLIVADEPTSALDVSVQGQVMNVLLGLQRQFGLTYLFISHNLSLVLSVADRVGVMYLGAMVEVAPASLLARAPAHPYTAALLAANPDPDARRGAFEDAGLDIGEVDLHFAPDERSGCRFRNRCPRAADQCRVEEPALQTHGTGRHVACHFPLVASSTADVHLAGANKYQAANKYQTASHHTGREQ